MRHEPRVLAAATAATAAAAAAARTGWLQQQVSTARAAVSVRLYTPLLNLCHMRTRYHRYKPCGYGKVELGGISTPRGACCADAGFGCFKRAGRSFAMCKPQPSPCAGDQGELKGWVCPEEWIHHSPSTPPPTPPPPPPHSPCSASFDACWETGCCNTRHFTCQRRAGA